MMPVEKRKRYERAPWMSLPAAGLFLLLLLGCARPAVEETPQRLSYPEKLSAYGLFVGNGSTQEPADGVIPYDLNTPLFTDYATKYRFVKLPLSSSAAYDETDAFVFPVGTIIAKTLAYPHDMTDLAKGQRLLETRLLIHEPEGWVGLTYVWNDQQTEATLRLVGATVEVSWIHTDGGRRHNDYLIPNVNQCKGCHKTHDKAMWPIGPKARHLNKDFVYRHGAENQLAYWTRTGALSGAPEPRDAPRAPVWNDPSTGSLHERARSYLDINCAYCHNPGGAARNTGLDLSAFQTTPYKYGVYKSPVAAGGGSGGRFCAIVPGKPEESILIYRMRSTSPAAMMPELGKRLVHTEGVELIKEWIAALEIPPPDRAP